MSFRIENTRLAGALSGINKGTNVNGTHMIELWPTAHLPYGITQCYLLPDTRNASHQVLDLPTPEGWKAELT